MKKYNLAKMSFLLFQFISLFYTTRSLATDDDDGPTFSVEELMGWITGFLYVLGIALGLFFIIKAGYTYMTSQGAPDKVKQAQEDLTAAITGIIFIVLSGVILRIIISSLFNM